MERAFKALASNPRRRILNHLAGGPMTVGEIAEHVLCAAHGLRRRDSGGFVLAHGGGV